MLAYDSFSNKQKALTCCIQMIPVWGKQTINQPRGLHVSFQVIDECRVEIDREEFLKKFDDSMMLACHAWCEGKEFAEVCALVDMFEGSVVRLMRRIQEVRRRVCATACSCDRGVLEGGQAYAAHTAGASSGVCYRLFV